MVLTYELVLTIIGVVPEQKRCSKTKRTKNNGLSQAVVLFYSHRNHTTQNTTSPTHEDRPPYVGPASYRPFSGACLVSHGMYQL